MLLAVALKQLAAIHAVKLLVADQAAALKWLLAIHAVKLLDVQVVAVQVADQAAEPKWLAAMLADLLAATAVADVARKSVVVFSRRSSHARRRAAVMRVHAMHVLLLAAPARVLHRLQWLLQHQHQHQLLLHRHQHQW